MNTVLWQNTASIAVYKGGKLIQPGETREVPAHSVAPVVEVFSSGIVSSDAPVSLETLLASSLRDLEPLLPGLAPEQLQELKALENKRDAPRKSVIDALDAEIIKRASAR